MQWLAIIAILVLTQQSAKAPQSDGTADLNSTQSAAHARSTRSNPTPSTQSAPVPRQVPAATESQRSTATTNDHAGTSSQGTSDEDRATQRKLISFTGVLAVVGVLQAGIMFLQLLVYRRQAHEMTRQRHETRRQRYIMEEQGQIIVAQLRAMHEQVTEMSVQSGILQESVSVARDAAKAAQDGANAAKESADATRDSVEMFVSKERPWLRITLDDWKAIPHNDETRFIVMTFHLQRFGATDALIVNSYIYGMLTDSIDPSSATGVLGQSITMKTIITSADTAETRMTWVSKREGGWDESPTPQDVDDIYVGEKTVHVWGAINYKDVFGREHWTKFRYRWVLNPFGSNGHWEKCGKPEDNCET